MRRFPHRFPQRAPLQELGNEIFKLVSYGATSEQWAEWLRATLEHAVARGNLDLVNTTLVVQAGADCCAGWRRRRRDRTPLDTAAVVVNPDVVTALLQAGAQPDVNVVPPSPTSMHIFPARVPLQELGGEIFELVSYGATPRKWAAWLRVPLEHAAARGNLDLVNTLLQGGADGRAGWRGCRGRTLLHAAAVGGNPGVVTALLRAGAQPDVNVVSMSPKRSALFVATVCGHEEVARLLIQAGADVSFRDAIERGSVLHEACCGHEQLVKDLLVAGADPNSDFGPRGSTPIHQAAGAGHCGIISALLLRGVNKDALDHLGATPLMWAASWGQVAAVDTLVAAGADVNIRDDNQHAALNYAANEGRVPVLKALLGHGAYVDFPDTNGYTALHMAAMNNRADAVDALVEAGADIELDSNDDYTPLMAAAYFSQRKSMLALLKRGAIVGTCSTFGRTPLHVACLAQRHGLEVAVDLLLRWGADETALDEEGFTPTECLDHALDGNERPCSPEEIERVRVLLARAPADRAWRRRCLLVMLRSRASKARTEGHGDGGTSSNTCDIHAVEAGGAASCPSAGSRDFERDRDGQGCGIGDGEAGVGADDGDFGRLLMIGLEMDGVFRTVVGFL
eukprot:g13730.t1